MNMIWLCITAVLSITPLICGLHIDTSHIRVFPAMDQSVAGVFQVSRVNHLNQPEYGFNASDARRLCVALGVSMASKAQVQAALTRGLETCRFGWIDEHLAIIPRKKALSNCGQNQTGLVTWRASVTQKFDVFCFNESDAATQLKDTTTDSPVTSSHLTSPSTSNKTLHSSSSPPTSSSSTSETADNEVEPARFVSSAGGSAGAILITSTCVLLLVAVIILAYIKMRRSCSDKKQQQQEYIQTEQWTCVTTVKETKKAAQEDKGIEVVDEAS